MFWDERGDGDIALRKGFRFSFPDDAHVKMEAVTPAVGGIPEALILEALLQLTESVDMLHAKLNALTEKMGQMGYRLPSWF